jgi:hypothetical protein
MKFGYSEVWMNRAAVRTLREATGIKKGRNGPGRLPQAVSQTLEQLECRRLLSGSIAITSSPALGDTNLTTEGNADWFSVGYPASATTVQTKNKVVGPRLSVVTVTGSAASATTPGKTFTWTDATPAIGTDVTQPTDLITVVDGQNDGDQGGASPATEGVANVLDNTTQKYLNFQDLGSGVMVTPAANGGNGTTISGIRLYTANDSAERDPASYKLEGSNDGGATWSVISAGPLNLPAERNTVVHAIDPNVDFNQTLIFDNSTSYKTYRVTFPTLKNSAGANSMQIGEIELLSKIPAENATATSDASAVTGSGNGFHFTVPASPIPHELKVYVGVDGGSGTLTTTLGDNSVGPKNSVLTDTNNAGATLAVYTIDFQSTLDNSTMSIDWVGSGGATVLLSAATWSVGAQLTVTPTTGISGDTNLSEEGNLDWEQIGFPTDPTVINSKQGVTGRRISDFTPIGSFVPVATTTPGKTFTWTDAPPAGMSDVTSATDPVTIVNGANDGDAEAGVPPGGETEIHAFDDSTSKYLNFLDLNSGVIVTPAANGGKGTLINAIRFYTANDTVERDPGSYTLEGSNDGGATWTSIAGGDLALPDGRNNTGLVPDPTVNFNQLMTFSNRTAYKSYRVRFPTLKNAAATNSMQIGEIELLQRSVGNATTSDADAVTGNGNGFHFTVPARPVLRRVKVYVGIDDGGTGTLTATLSDGSVVPATFVLNDTNATGATLAVYQIDFKSALANQTLSVDWVASNGGTAIISAASWIELTAPTAPQTVSALAVGQGKINISWADTAANEQGFLIERAPDLGGAPGDFVQVGTTPENITQFVDSGLSSSTKYYYRVSAYNPLGAALAVGNPVSATTRAATATGLVAQFWNDPFTGTTPTGHVGSGGDEPVFTEVEPNVGVDWGLGSPNPAVNADYFSSQWDGTYVADYSGPTTFYVNTDDGGRFFIDLDGNGTFEWDANAAGTSTPQGELVVNTWSDHGQGLIGGKTVNLIAGHEYKIRMQQFEHTGAAAAFLYMQTPSSGDAPLIIPTGNVSSVDTTSPTLVGDPEIDRPLPATAVYTAKQHVVLQFSEPIVINPSATLSLFGSDGFVYNGFATLDDLNTSVVLTFPDLPLQELPTANYRLYLPAFAITDTAGNPLDGNADGFGGDDYLTDSSKSFYSLKGDTQAGPKGIYDGDRKVSFVDFQRLETNFGKTVADRPAASDGDVNHDGVIDRLDLQIIAGTMGNSLFKPFGAAAVPSLPVSSPTPDPVPVSVPAPVVKPKAIAKAGPAPVTVAKTLPVASPVSLTVTPSASKPAAVAKPVAGAGFSKTRVNDLKDWLSA